MGRKISLIFLFFIASIFISARYWVFFEEKGYYNKSALDDIYRALPERTRNRRAKAGIISATELDLPLKEEYIHSVERIGARFILSSKWLNGAVFEFSDNVKFGEILRLPFVREVRPVAVYRRRAPEILAPPPTYADTFYGYSTLPIYQLEINRMHRIGFNGEGVRICLLDTGARLTHRAFDSLQVVATWDFINNDPDISYDPTQDYPEQPYHGTYTLGVIGGYLPGTLVGVAYKAEFLLAKTEIVQEEIRVEESYWVRGLEWAESLGVDIVSSSLGYTEWYSREDVNGRTAITTRAANIAASLGVLVVTSAGNERGTAWNYIIVPADAESVISVGAVDRFGAVTPFSSPGPTYDGRIKPELVALGSAVPTSSPTDSTGIIAISGTSMSTPLVAGACALLLQAIPSLTPMQLKEILLSFADQFFEPDTNAGWGIPSPFLSYTTLPTLYLYLYDAETLMPLDTTRFLLQTADTSCTLYTNGRGICRYYPSLSGEYRLIIELSPNRFFTYKFNARGSGKEVIRIPVNRRFEESIRVYPNPFADSCTIILERPSKGRLLVYSPSGTILYEKEFQSPYSWKGTNLNGKKLPAGVYIIVISSEGEKYVKRVGILR
ncbi:MAG: S8 family peptidase [bacterium]